MKFQIGDRIVLTHSNEEAVIVKFINKEMAMVETGGVTFAAYLDQMDFPYFKNFTEKKQEKKKQKVFIDSVKKEKNTYRYAVSEGVWLAMIPVFDKDIFDEDIVEYLKIYLVNHTNESFHFNYNLKYAGSESFELQNEIFAMNDFYIHDIPFENLNDAPKFCFEFSLLQKDATKAAYFETEFKIKARQLFQKIEALKQKQQASLSFLLFEKFPEKAKNEIWGELNLNDFSSKSLNRKMQSKEIPQIIIDLHIEKFESDWKQLSNYEILQLQMQRFEKYYYLALQHGQDFLIVVHGVGSGKLRDEIHEFLKLQKEVKSFINQYHPSFGYGATEIFFN